MNRPGQPLKSLPQLAAIYDGSVGSNANLLLNFAPTYNGNLPAESLRAYDSFGAWIKRCYGSAVASTAPGTMQVGQQVILAPGPGPRPGLASSAPPALAPAAAAARGGGVVAVMVDRIVLQEDQSKGCAHATSLSSLLCAHSVSVFMSLSLFISLSLSLFLTTALNYFNLLS